MNEAVPDIYWYFFWVGVVVIAFGCMMFGGMLHHRVRMKELEILAMYADKGVHPPRSVASAMAAGRAEP